MQDINLVSIIIPTFNVLHLTKECLISIFHNTVHPYELIIVDNASTDDTVKFIKKEIIPLPYDITFIQNDTNLGFAKACNQGIKVSKGDYILLLNSDTYVTLGWLTKLVQIVLQHTTPCIVTPVSRGIHLDQFVDNSNTVIEADVIRWLRDISVSAFSYEDSFQLEIFAENIWNTFKYRTLTMQVVFGFCMLIPHLVIDSVGLLDERYGMGLVEDGDYCWRARLKKITPLLALGVYIHHHLSASFKAAGVDMKALLDQNLALFQEKQKNYV